MTDPSGDRSRGAPGLPRESGDLRRRYAEAAAELLHGSGWEAASVDAIAALAGTDRASFDEVFPWVDDCLAYGVDLAAEELFAVLDAQDAEGPWPARLREAIVAFYGFVASRPALADLLLVHSAVMRPDATWDIVERFAVLLRRARAETDASRRDPLPPITEEFLSRGIVALAARRVGGAGIGGLPGEAHGVTTLVARFYLDPGSVEAALGGPAAEPSST